MQSVSPGELCLVSWCSLVVGSFVCIVWLLFGAGSVHYGAPDGVMDAASGQQQWQLQWDWKLASLCCARLARALCVCSVWLRVSQGARDGGGGRSRHQHDNHGQVCFVRVTSLMCSEHWPGRRAPRAGNSCAPVWTTGISRSPSGSGGARGRYVLAAGAGAARIARASAIPGSLVNGVSDLDRTLRLRRTPPIQLRSVLPSSGTQWMDRRVGIGVGRRV